MQGWWRAREVTVSVKQGTDEQTTLSRLTTHDLTSFLLEGEENNMQN